MKPSSHARVDAAVVGANLPARTPDCARWEFLLRAWSVSDGLLPRLNQVKERKLNHIRLLLRLFPRCIVRQFQEKQPFIRAEGPQRKLRRPIARLDHTRIFHLFDVFVILCPLHRVESQLRVLIFDLERAGVDVNGNFLLGKPGLGVEAMTFYQACLGGVLNIQTVGESPMAGQMPPALKDNVLHSVLAKDGFVLMASDMKGPEGVVKGNIISLCIIGSNKAELEPIFAKLSAGGTVS